METNPLFEKSGNFAEDDAPPPPLPGKRGDL